MERMEKDQLVKRMIGSDARGVKLTGRPRMGLMNYIKRALNERGVFVEQGRMIMHDRGQWREVMNARVRTQP